MSRKSGWNRREFLKAMGAGAAVAGFALPVSAAGTPLPTRPLGKTGFVCSVLGIGVAPLGMKNTDAKPFEEVVNAALDAGINYVDVAPNYGNSEERLGPVMAKRREGVFLVTKVEDPTKDGAIRQLENSLRLMRTDHVDAAHLHSMGDLDPNVVLRKGGALEGLQEAKKRGLLRFIGVSGHSRPSRFLPAFETGEIDLTMPAINFVDRHTYNFEGQVLPEARKRGIAVVAMKTLGGAVGMTYHIPTPALLAGEEHYPLALRYVLELEGISSLVVGVKSVEELNQALQVVKTATPLTPTERAWLTTEGQRLAKEWGAHFGEAV